MTDINTVIIHGRLTRDAELKYSQSGFAIMNFSVAVNKSKKEGDGWKDEAHFFDCSMFGKRAESIAQYLTKGVEVVVKGSLEQQRWEAKQVSHSKVSIVVDDINLVGGKKQKDPYAPAGDLDPPF